MALSKGKRVNIQWNPAKKAPWDGFSCEIVAASVESIDCTVEQMEKSPK